MSKEINKSYKGFDKDLKCRGFQYEIGKEYEHDGPVKACQSGFHACEAPLDVFKYYAPGQKSRYCEVEQSGKTDRDGKDTKVASSKIKIGAEIGIPGLVKAQIKWTKERASKQGCATSGDWSSAATSGEESSAATSGYRSSAATSGYWSSAATSGDWSSAATSGEESSAATSGYRSSAATSGYRSSAATSGDWSSAATSGYRSSAATSGSGSSAATSGEESSAATSNANAIALACGKNSKAKGVIGSYIVMTEWDAEQENLLLASMVRIDGEIYKPDTWYTLKNGEIVEAAT